MRTVTLQIHDSQEELPTASGRYLCITKEGLPLSLPYSPAHKAFNVTDATEEKDVKKRGMYPAKWIDVEPINDILRREGKHEII